VQHYVREQLAGEISVETLAGLVNESVHYRVFKQVTGMSLQFVTRERITSRSNSSVHSYASHWRSAGPAISRRSFGV
jgi:hypothetical protein